MPVTERPALKGRPGPLHGADETLPAPPGEILVLLSFATGVADAFAFLVFHGIFSANMTGNLILVALFDRQDYGVRLASAGVGLFSFSLALFVGFSLTTRRRREPDAGLEILTAAVLSQGLVAVAWVSSARRPGLTPDLAILALACAASAFQTVAARRIGADRSISTTFATGTLAGLIQDVVDGVRGERWVRLLLVAALPAGAGLGAATMAAAPLLTPALPALLGLVALCLLRRRSRAV